MKAYIHTITINWVHYISLDLYNCYPTLFTSELFIINLN